MAAIGSSQNGPDKKHPILPQHMSIFNVMEYGAIGDGIADDTRAIQHTIDICHKLSGGEVLVPGGTFVTGTLVLKDNVTLNVSPGATLLGSPRLQDYRPLNYFTTQIPPFLGEALLRDISTFHLIYAEKAKNIGITGLGKIDGQGPSFWDGHFKPLERPGQMIQFEACENVLLQNVVLQNSPAWTLHILGCDNVKIQNITIKNHRNGPNTDGIDVNSSSNVLICNSFIDTGDDCICLKARLEEKSCENILVSNCILYTNHSALKLGTHSIGTIKDCLFDNCTIYSTFMAIGLYMKDGGAFDGIKFANLTIQTGATGNSERQVFPLIIDTELRTSLVKPGSIKNISFCNIDLKTTGRCFINGMKEHPIDGLTLDNVRMHVPSCDDANHSSKPRGIMNSIYESPEADYSSISAHFIMSCARHIVLSNFQVHVHAVGGSHERHALWGNNLSDVTIDGFREKTEGQEQRLSSLKFLNCRDLFIRGFQSTKSMTVFLQMEGRETRNVNVMGNDLHTYKIPFSLSADVNRDALFESTNRLP